MLRPGDIPTDVILLLRDAPVMDTVLKLRPAHRQTLRSPRAHADRRGAQRWNRASSREVAPGALNRLASHSRTVRIDLLLALIARLGGREQSRSGDAVKSTRAPWPPPPK